MKKLLFIILLSLFQHEVRAQHFTLTIIHAPCDSDGVVVANLDSSYTPYGTYVDGILLQAPTVVTMSIVYMEQSQTLFMGILEEL